MTKTTKLTVSQDLGLIGEKYLDYPITLEKSYLLKYFDTDVQVAFLLYYMVFGNTKYFQDHTGHYISSKWRKVLTRRIKKLEKLAKEAKDAALEGDFESLETVQMGKIPAEQLLKTELKDIRNELL